MDPLQSLDDYSLARLLRDTLAVVEPRIDGGLLDGILESVDGHVVDRLSDKLDSCAAGAAERSPMQIDIALTTMDDETLRGHASRVLAAAGARGSIGFAMIPHLGRDSCEAIGSVIDDWKSRYQPEP